MSVGRLNEINSLSKNNWLAGNSALRLTHRLLINVTNKLPTGPEESSHLYYFFIFYRTRISRFSLRNKKKTIQKPTEEQIKNERPRLKDATGASRRYSVSYNTYLIITDYTSSLIISEKI